VSVVSTIADDLFNKKYALIPARTMSAAIITMMDVLFIIL